MERLQQLLEKVTKLLDEQLNVLISCTELALNIEHSVQDIPENP